MKEITQLIDNNPINNSLESMVSYERICCLIITEFLMGIYLIKTSVLQDLDFHELSKSYSIDQLETKFIHQLKNIAHLNLLIKHNYGEIVNMKDIPDTQHPELYRIFENYLLWERRYITPEVGINPFVNDNYRNFHIHFCTFTDDQVN